MNEFDLKLESDLRLLLDPLVATPGPARKIKGGHREPVVKLRVLTPTNLAAIPVEAVP